jgi:hypothetical protein
VQHFSPAGLFHRTLPPQLVQGLCPLMGKTLNSEVSDWGVCDLFVKSPAFCWCSPSLISRNFFREFGPKLGGYVEHEGVMTMVDRAEVPSFVMGRIGATFMGRTGAV